MPNLESGKRLADRYLLQERLGDGGHAEVWGAIDARDGRRVALKFLHAASCGADEYWHVLQHEAAMSQRLDHPGVLRVEAPQRDGELVFLPMELAEGGDVRALRGAPWRTVLPVLLQVARILEHAHSRGVVHRDIKPGNVLLAADGSVRVTDFGTAARTGSTLALADGSPFSASPQQLAGQPAITADDVYGLGALAYELLSRYPPYYPDFDPRQVQEQMPAPLAAAHPAPPQLLAFVTDMLERDPLHRPDLGQVIEFFTQCLQDNAPAHVSGAAMVVPESTSVDAPPAPRAAARGGRLAVLGLVAAAAAAAALFIFMPKPGVEGGVAPAAAPVVPSVAASAAAAAEPAGTPGPEVTQTSGPAAVTLEEELAAGKAALAASQPAAARAAFERALLRDPANAPARAGVAASLSLARALDAYSLAMRAEAAADVDAASTGYGAALELEPGFAPAKAGLARMQQAVRQRAFEAALGQGAADLAAGRVQAAEANYQRAAQLGGADERVREGQQRIAEIRRSERNASDLARGTELENQEQWLAAQEHYREVLARDDGLGFAVDGLARSMRRGELDAELQDYLDRPERLVAAPVRAAANRALARGQSSSAPTTRLGAQLRQLKARLDALDTRVSVEISSDNSTAVFVAPVGELGQFSQLELQLAPGQYTVIGRREGYRDVRRELNITPGQQRAAVTVQCSEKI